MAEVASENLADGSPVAKTAARWEGLPLVILATACWSTAGVFITSLVRDGGFSTFGLAFWRILVTSVCLFAYIALRHPQQLRVKLRDLPWFAAMGALAVATFQVMWILAVMTNGPSIATIVQCNAPIIVTVIARLIWGEAITWQKWTAILLATIGTVLLAWPGETTALNLTLAGLLISLGSACAYAAITLFTKQLARDYSSWTILALAFGFAALALLPFQFGLGPAAGPSHFLPSINRTGVLATFAAFVLITTIGGYATLYLGAQAPARFRRFYRSHDRGAFRGRVRIRVPRRQA
jgi:drug/metabolite transporter (DMT)-like permease